MTQLRLGLGLSLAPVRTISRATDPSTSHKSARAMLRSGTLADCLHAALVAVSAYDGGTVREIAGGDDARVWEYAKRMRPLERLGLVRAGAPRPCRFTTRDALTWWMTDAGRTAVAGGTREVGER